MNYKDPEWIKTRNEFANLTAADDRLSIAESCIALAFASMCSQDHDDLAQKLMDIRNSLTEVRLEIRERLSKFYPDQ